MHAGVKGGGVRRSREKEKCGVLVVKQVVY